MILERISKVVNVRVKIELFPSEPRRLSASIAKIPPPPTEHIPYVSQFKTTYYIFAFFAFFFKRFFGVILANLRSLIEKILILASQLGNYCIKV